MIHKEMTHLRRLLVPSRETLPQAHALLPRSLCRALQACYCRSSEHSKPMQITRRVAIGSGLALGLSAQTPVAPPSTTLKVGDQAPDFSLPSTDGGTVHIADYLGKSTVVLAFFPAAFTGG